MSRVQAEDYGDKRQAILDAAAALFARIGYANAKLADVARACRASKSMLYHYFPAKEDVLFEIVRDHAQGNLTALEEVLAREDPPEERLRALIVTWVRRSLSARAGHAVLMYDLKFLPRRQHQAIVDLERRMIEGVGGLIGEVNPAVRRGHPPQHKTYALLLFGMLNWTETWFRGTGPLSADEMAERIFRLFLRGLAAER